MDRKQVGRLLALAALLAQCAPAQSRQNPSPMVEHTRAHRRIETVELPGTRHRLALGTLYIPRGLKLRDRMPLWVHFHGAPEVVESAAQHLRRLPVVTVQLGAGSAVYAKPFADPAAIRRLVAEAGQQAGETFEPLILSSWSAGYGAIREILRQPDLYAQVERLLVLDSIHAGYVSGSPGPLESELVPADLETWIRLANDAIAGRKRLLVTHSEVFPGTFASTTETADYLVRQVGANRWPVLKWGPVGMQQLSEVRYGGLEIQGFAGNSAPDHVDHLHGIGDFMRRLLSGRRIPRLN